MCILQANVKHKTEITIQALLTLWVCMTAKAPLVKSFFIQLHSALSV